MVAERKEENMKDVTKKKAFAGILVAAVLALCLTLVGCGGSDNNSNSSGGTTEIPEEVKAWAGAWQSKSEIVPGAGEQETEAYVVNLNIDKTFTVTEDGVELYAGTWEPDANSPVAGNAKIDGDKEVRLELAANNTKLIFDGLENGAKKIICVR